MHRLLPTTLVGSYAQPDWLIDREKLAGRFPPRVRAKELWRVAPEFLEAAQVDEAYMQARPEKARQFGLKALNAALDGVTGTTAVHICFGYAAIIHVRPEGYSFLPEFANSPVRQVSIETAQSKLDCAVLETLPGKTILLGVIDLSDMTVETPEVVAARIRRALPHQPAERIIVAPDCGLKYLPRDVAFGKMCAMVEGAKIVRREVTGRAAF